MLAGLKLARQRLAEAWGLPVGCLLLAALAARVLWLAYTRLTAEDAFITFRFARQLAQGNGFTYNTGDPVYGTSTPLLTLLLAAWNGLLHADIVVGAHALGLAASVGSLILLDAVLRHEHMPASTRLLVLGVVGFCSKVLILDLQGMEMPLVICLMMASWLAFSRRHAVWTGFLAGCLLWTRIDLALWPAVLVLVEARRHPRGAGWLAFTAALTYLPWFAFAFAYFGSPIPFTVTAKLVAHGVAGVPILRELDTILGYLSPLDLPLVSRIPFLLAGAVTTGLAAWHATRIRHSQALWALSVFAGVEAIALALTRATFQARYLYPLLWAVLILAALGTASLLQGFVRRQPRFAATAGVLFAAFLLFQAGVTAERARAIQEYRYQGSLRVAGLWLAARAPAQASVLLEPLGYVGYYSGLRMIDEVGLVSPQVVELKLRGVPVEQYFAVFHPDYVVEHCDDATRFEGTRTDAGLQFADEYTRAATFDPLESNTLASLRSRYPGMDRGACYIIFQRKEGGAG